MAISENRFRRILREEARRVMNEVDKAAATAAGGAALGLGVPAATGATIGSGAGAALGMSAGTLASNAAAVGGLAGAGVGAVIGSVVLGGALLGLGVGTLINKGLNAAGINDAVIDWILAQRASKVGYDFEVRVDESVLAGNLDKTTGKLTATGAAGSLRPMSFRLTGVRGVLIDPETMKVLNNKSFFGFTGVADSPINGVAKARMPKPPGGILAPAELIGQVIYESGAVVNLVSRENSLVAVPGTSTIKGTLVSSKKLGT